MATALRAEELLALARERTGLTDLGDPIFREGLDVLTADLARAELHDVGRMVWRGRILGHLVQRLRVEDWLARHPQILGLEVPAPIFVVGLPRTGTTALSHLLAQDPETRSLRVWESAQPVPPPELASEAGDPRIETTTQQLAAMRQVSPRLAALHEDTPTGPTENQDLLGMSFRTLHFEGMAWIPRYVAWWLACDMVPAYRFAKRVLQLLQSRRPPTRWHLKSPPDAFCLDAVLEVFPDARFVMTHRDPAVVLGSVCSLLTMVQEMTGKPTDPRVLGRAELAVWVEGMRRLVAMRERIGEERFADVHFHELAADPVASVARVYARIGLPFTAAVEARIADQARANPRGRHGEHRYRLEDWGLDRAGVHDAFRSYTDRCAVKRED
jgi:sulfotransferase family protein